jgi:hypothetical protein
MKIIFPRTNCPNVSGAPIYLIAQGTKRGVSSKICIKYATGTSHKIVKSIIRSPN